MNRFAFLIVLMILALFFFIVAGCEKKNEPEAKDNSPAVQDSEVYTVDSVKHEIVKTIMKKGEVYPLANPATKEKTLWKAYYCNNCKTVFGEKPGTTATECPKCGSTDFAADTVKDHLDAPVWDQ